MQTEKTKVSDHIHYFLQSDHGFFNSATITQSPRYIFEFCQNDENIKKILNDLPLNLENFLDLTLARAIELDSDQYKVEWKNRDEAEISGNLNFVLWPAPQGKGTLLIAEANFENTVEDDDNDPSDLIKVFLRRLKALAETGVIATTTGQPSGREAVAEEKTIH